jgi:hypothetical protein
LFGWTKKKEPKTQSLGETLLSLPPQAFCAAIESAIQNEIPATCAMYVVAYDNLRPLSSAARTTAVKHGDPPFSIDDFIRMIGEKVERWRDDEIRSRRMLWFFMAANLARLDKLARQQEALIDAGARCWIKLAGSAKYLKTLLPDNVVWSPDEKVWYDLLETDRDFYWHVLSHTMPPQYARHHLVSDFAKRNSVSLFSRSGDAFTIE